MKTEDEIELTIEFDGLPFAAPETDSPSISLLRPFRRIAQSGKPTGRINYVFFQEDNSWYNVGSLCYSPKKLLLFFPGLTFRSIKWFKARNHTLREEDLLGMIDHLTLEPGFKQGHITTSTGKRINHMTKPIATDTWFWFGMSTMSATVLEPFYSKVKFSFTCPPGDSDRRIKDIMRAREDAIFHTTSLPDTDKVRDDEYLHFGFFVGPGDQFLASDFPVVPPLSAVLSDEKKEEFPVRVHPVSLQGLNGRVWIRVSKHFGKLPNEAQFILA